MLYCVMYVCCMCVVFVVCCRLYSQPGTEEDTRTYLHMSAPIQPLARSVEWLLCHCGLERLAHHNPLFVRPVVPPVVVSEAPFIRCVCVCVCVWVCVCVCVELELACVLFSNYI